MAAVLIYFVVGSVHHNVGKRQYHWCDKTNVLTNMGVKTVWST